MHSTIDVDVDVKNKYQCKHIPHTLAHVDPSYSTYLLLKSISFYVYLNKIAIYHLCHIYCWVCL